MLSHGRFSLSYGLGAMLRLNLWQNLTNHPFDALNEFVLLSSTANFLIYFQSVKSPFLILAKIRPSIQLSVGLPPPYFLQHPFFFHRSKLRLGMPDYLEMIFTSQPAKIYIVNRLLFRLPAFSRHKYIYDKDL